MRVAALLALPLRRTSQRWHWLVWLLRLAVTAYIVLLVYAKLHEQAYDWTSVWRQAHPLWLLAAMALLPANLGLETVKWWGLVRRFYPWLSWRGAALRVLAGAAVGFITPNRWGEYAGRVLSLPRGHRTEAAMATLLSRLAQLAAALVAGAVALANTPLPGWVPSHWRVLIVVAVAVLAVAVMALTCLPDRALAPLLRLPRWRWLPLWQVHAAARRIPVASRIWTLVLGLGRYLVFVLQVGLALWAYGATVDSWTILQFCGLLFLGKALVPSIALAELGVREALALGIATAMGLPLAAVFNATLLIFAVNLLVPAVLGAVCLWWLTPVGSAPAAARA